MRFRAVLLAAAIATPAAAQRPPVLATGGRAMPPEWIDSATGHRVVRLTQRDAPSTSFYFHNDPFVVDSTGTRMVFYGTTPTGRQLFTVDLRTRALAQLTDRAGGVSGEIVAHRRREAVWQKGDSVFATHVDRRTTRLLAVLPAELRASVTTLNADETLLAGVSAGPALREILAKYPTKSEFFDRIFAAHVPHALFTVDLRTGAVRVVHREDTWLGHVQFSPTDPELLMFCHEGPWHLVDRIWHVNVRTGETRLMHRRTVEREIAGHEFFSPDGRTIWYDLQVPRGETFFLAGADVRTGAQRRWALARDAWSIHFTASPVGPLWFAGDGGDSTQVARARNGRWIYRLTPRGDSLAAERLVDMRHHAYRALEPDVHVSPDGRWVVFRANFEGASQVYAVEAERAPPRTAYQLRCAPGELAPTTTYDDASGYGFRAPLPAGDACASARPFHLDLALPPGDYDVTLTLGDRRRASETTVRAEARRLVLERVRAGAGESVTRTFTVNVRRPDVPGTGDSVRLKAREVGSPSWDDRLTLELSGPLAALRAVRVAPTPRRLPHVYLAGNSTVVDQQVEPYAAWGQMLPRFFRPGTVVVANHAESGETLKSFVSERRFAKVLSELRAGDWLFVEFAHNDQKPGGGYAEPFGAYTDLLRRFVDSARARGATPVLVTSTARRAFDSAGRVTNTLGDYPAAMRQLAAREHVALIDLNAMTTRFYQALGAERAKRALVHVAANTYPGQTEPIADDTHFSDYGAYELARMVVQGIRDARLPLARALLPDVPRYDPSHPSPPERFALPPSPPPPAPADYVFAYFHGNGDGLHLAHSTDGLTWRAVRGDSVLFRPTVGTERLLRDPSIARAADGTYHMVWTTGWRERGFGYATSRDLVHWTSERFVPVMAHEPTASNVWAPELFRDEANERWMVLWATTIPGRFPRTDTTGVERYDHRIYYTTTRDFATWTPAALLYEPGFSVIDAQLVRDGARYVMFLKNETDRPPEKNVRLAFADRAEGPWSAPTAPITGRYWAEGPAALRVGGRWYVYVDRYREHRYGALWSDDLARWTDVTDRLVVPAGIRHGTALAVPAADARRLTGGR